VDFDLSEEQRLFHDTTRRFLESECPLTVVRKLADAPAGFDRGWWRRTAALGWTGLLADEADGGTGLGPDGPVYLGIVAENMGRLVAPSPLLVTSVVVAALTRAGSAAQRLRHLGGLLAGDSVATWCFAEGGRRWQPEDVRVEARRTANGYRLNGEKSPVEAAAQADLLLVTARAEEGLTQFLVPADTPGVAVAPLESLDLVRRFGRVRFEDVEVPASGVLGRAGGADADVEHQLRVALALQCVESSGAADRVFEFTEEWAFDRYSFGRPLASYQALKHRFADLKMWLEACHATSSAAIRAVASGAGNAGRLVRVAKVYVGDHAPEIVQDCVQMHGGIGVTWDHDIHLYLRRVATNREVYGAPREHRARIGAELVA
jgi:alkylation response protein AidB-like acyl-CoA dehydrogenase